MNRALLLGLFLAAAAPLPAADPPAVPTAVDPRAIVGPPRGQPLSGPALAKRTEAVAALLRCPVCQGLSVADSPATMAQKMKAQVGEMLSAGYDQEQILAYFESSYGEFVRLEPPLRGINWLVWLGPALGLGAGGVIVAWALRRPLAVASAPEEAAAGDLPQRDTLPDDPDLAACVLKVRELAYGWPGGRPPESRA